MNLAQQLEALQRLVCEMTINVERNREWVFSMTKDASDNTADQKEIFQSSGTLHPY